MPITKLEDPEQTRNRAEILNKTFQGLLILHGGASVALLAFLQSIWPNPKLAAVILDGMLWLLVGMVLAILWQASRYHVSYIGQFGSQGVFKFIRRVGFVFQYSSIVVFVIAIGTIVCGAKALLAGGG